MALTKLPLVAHAFGAINDAVGTISAASRAGSSFVFGYLGGGALPFDLKAPGADFILAFQALPVVLVMSVLTTLLFYWKILPPVVRGMSWLLERTLGVGGAVGLSTAANIFLGMVEAPLFIRPYLARLTRSELFLVMTGGMAGIAGTVLVLYATLLAPMIPDAAAHFVIASVLAAPAAILVSLIMVPETSDQRTAGVLADPRGDPAWRSSIPGGRGRSRYPAPRPWMRSSRAPPPGSNCCSTSSRCCWCWWRWSISPTRCSGCCRISAVPRSRCSGCSATLMAPVCWLMGLPWPQAVTAGSLMGVKTVLNELIAYVDLSKLGTDALDPRSRLIMLYAMCGFANFGSLGIMIGGLGTMAPQRRDEINALGLKSIVSGTLTTCLMGAMVGVIDVIVIAVIPGRAQRSESDDLAASRRIRIRFASPRNDDVAHDASSTVLNSAGKITSSNSTSSE